MSNLLTKVRKLNWLLQESPTGAFSFDEMCGILSDLMDANILRCQRSKGKGVRCETIKSNRTALRFQIRRPVMKCSRENTMRNC